MNIEVIKSQVAINAPRIKELGNWPSHLDEMSLVHRIPDERENRLTAPGFDAGIACCLDLIPRNKQKLSAILHGAYTPEAVEQVRQELNCMLALASPTICKTLDEWFDSFGSIPKDFNDPMDFETCWWLAASYFCSEGDCDSKKVLEQIDNFKKIENSVVRFALALNCWERMKSSFHVVDNIPIALQDGGMQAAYIAGHKLSIMPAYGIWFVGTYLSTLGIPENFNWTNLVDSKGRPMSGPVFGSKQFVKCATFNELHEILCLVRTHLDT
jgi:hypothetical protein